MAAKTTAPTVPLSKVAAELAEKTGMTKKDASGALEEFVGLVVRHLKKGNKVRITGLGILQVRHRPPGNRLAARTLALCTMLRHGSSLERRRRRWFQLISLSNTAERMLRDAGHRLGAGLAHQLESRRQRRDSGC